MNPAKTSTTTAAQIIQANLAARLNLLQRGIRNRLTLQTQTAQLGGSINFNLQQIGLTTGVRLFVSVPLTVTAALTPSQLAPHNLIQSITVTDPNGINRSQVDGWSLNLIQSFKHRENHGLAFAFSGNVGDAGAINTNILNVPTTTAGGTLAFVLHVPFAYDAMSDLRGSILTQLSSGVAQLNIQFASALVGADSAKFPFTAGTATAGTISVIPVQEFLGTGNGIDIANPAQKPQLDLATVYGFQASDDNTNIVAGGNKQVNWPVNRTVHSALHFFENGNAGTLNETDVSLVTLLANTTSPILVGPPVTWRYAMRSLLGSDAASGAYYIGRRLQPVQTAMIGQVITQFNLETVAGAGTVNFHNVYELTYPLGSAQPAVAVA